MILEWAMNAWRGKYFPNTLARLLCLAVAVYSIWKERKIGVHLSMYSDQCR